MEEGEAVIDAGGLEREPMLEFVAIETVTSEGNDADTSVQQGPADADLTTQQTDPDAIHSPVLAAANTTEEAPELGVSAHRYDHMDTRSNSFDFHFKIARDDEEPEQQPIYDAEDAAAESPSMSVQPEASDSARQDADEHVEDDGASPDEPDVAMSDGEHIEPSSAVRDGSGDSKDGRGSKDGGDSKDGSPNKHQPISWQDWTRPKHTAQAADEGAGGSRDDTPSGRDASGSRHRSGSPSAAAHQAHSRAVDTSNAASKAADKGKSASKQPNGHDAAPSRHGNSSGGGRPEGSTRAAAGKDSKSREYKAGAGGSSSAKDSRGAGDKGGSARGTSKGHDSKDRDGDVRPRGDRDRADRGKLDRADRAAGHDASARSKDPGKPSSRDQDRSRRPPGRAPSPSRLSRSPAGHRHGRLPDARHPRPHPNYRSQSPWSRPPPAATSPVHRAGPPNPSLRPLPEPLRRPPAPPPHLDFRPSSAHRYDPGPAVCDRVREGRYPEDDFRRGPAPPPFAGDRYGPPLHRGPVHDDVRGLSPRGYGDMRLSRDDPFARRMPAGPSPPRQPRRSSPLGGHGTPPDLRDFRSAPTRPSVDVGARRPRPVSPISAHHPSPPPKRTRYSPPWAPGARDVRGGRSPPRYPPRNLHAPSLPRSYPGQWGNPMDSRPVLRSSPILPVRQLDSRAGPGRYGTASSRGPPAPGPSHSHPLEARPPGYAVDSYRSEHVRPLPAYRGGPVSSWEAPGRNASISSSYDALRRHRSPLPVPDNGALSPSKGPPPSPRRHNDWAGSKMDPILRHHHLNGTAKAPSSVDSYKSSDMMHTVGVPTYDLQPASLSPHMPRSPAASLSAGIPAPAVQRVDEDAKTWYYIDPQGATQGPCSIAQFRIWLQFLSDDPKYKREFEQFRSVDVWESGMPNRVPLMSLLTRGV